MKYRFKASRTFWKSFSKLPEQQRASAKAAFKIFKANPFDPRLRAHKINSLSSYYGKTVCAAVIEGDLRAAFYVEDDVTFTVDIGSHAIYRV
jgi:mRNA-degrading endonuclease YafQ of YafQ-DinJ toxin-antitoxin module